MTNQIQESAPNVSPQVVGQTAAGGAGGGPATSPDQGADLRSEIETLKAQLKGLQSIGDKREAKLTERFSTVEDYLKRAGLQPDQRIIREMQVDELLNNRPPQTSSQTQPNGNGQGLQTTQPTETDFLAILNAVGVDPNSNAVIRITTQYANNPTQLKAALVDYKAGQSQGQPTTAAAVAPSSGGVVSGNAETQLNELGTRLQTLMVSPSFATAQVQKEVGEIRQKMAQLRSA